MRVIVALIVGAFFGFSATAVVSVGAKQDAYDEGFRDGIKMTEDYFFEELEWRLASKTVPVDADSVPICVGDVLEPQHATSEGGGDDGNQPS